MSVTRARVCERAETEGCPRAELRQGDYPGTDRQTNTDFSQRAPRFIEGGAQASVTRVTSQSSAPTAHATCGDTSTGRDARQSPEVPPSGTEVGLVPPFGPPPPRSSLFPAPCTRSCPPRSSTRTVSPSVMAAIVDPTGTRMRGMGGHRRARSNFLLGSGQGQNCPSLAGGRGQ